MAISARNWPFKKDKTLNINPTKAGDLPALRDILDATALFTSEMLPEFIAGFLSEDPSEDLWLTCEKDGKAIGFCYAKPEEMTDGTWNMLAIAVMPAHQGTALGAALMRALETALKTQGARILIVDTSGTDDFALTRKFYQKNGYTQEARIRDFWAEGDDKIIFHKAL